MISINAYILNQITADIPNYTFVEINPKVISKLKLADQHFNIAGPIQILLGAEWYGLY